MLNPSNPAPLEDGEIFSPPIFHLTETPWSPQHEWPAQSFPGISGTPGFPEYPVTFSEDIVQAQADPQAPRHTVAVGAQAGHISGFTIGPQLQVEDGLGTSVVFMPGNAQPYSIAQPAALHRQPFDDTQPRDTEDYGAIFNFTANGTSAPTTSHGQGSYVLNNGAIAGVAPISPYAPQLPAYQNHCRDTAQNKIPAEQLAIDPRLIYDPPQDNISPTIAQRRAATSTRAERRAEPYPTSRVATTRAAHADAMSPTAAMLQRFAAAAQHGGHHAFDTNSSLQFNSVQEQMITSFPRSASTSGNTARRRYSSASSGYLSSGSSQSPTTPTPDMPFGMPYGPVSVGSPTSPILAAYNDWSMQIMPSLAAPQHQVFMPTFYAMDEPSTSYARHGHMATLVNTYGALATPTSPDPYLVARLPAVEETRRRGIEELEDDGQSATSQRSSKQTKHKKKVEEFRVESSEQQPRTGKALKEKKSRSKTSDRRQEYAAVNIGPGCLNPFSTGPNALPSRGESVSRTKSSLKGGQRQPGYEAERRGVGRGGAGGTKARKVKAGKRFPCTNAWNGCPMTFTNRRDSRRHLVFGACEHMPRMGAGSKLAKYKCDWPDCAKYLSRPDALARHRRRHIEKMRQQQERLAGKNERG